jgi:hypothetical protein
METAAVREKGKRPIKSFTDLPGYVVKHIDADPVETINQVLKFYGPGTIGDFNTRRHRATISMVVAVGALARRVRLLEARIDSVTEVLADVAHTSREAKKDLLKPAAKRKPSKRK